MAIKLIALDLDGTLLNSEKVITPRTMAAIKAAQARGVAVTIATGRMFKGAEVFGQQFGANAPLICCNGGVVQAMGAEQPLFARYLPAAVVRRLLAYCQHAGWYVNWYIGNDIYVDHYDEAFYYAYRTVPDMPFREVGEHYPDYTQHVYQCVLRDLSGEVGKKTAVLHAMFPNSLLAQQNTGCSADLTPMGVNKALGLGWLAQSMGLTPAEVMACGDGDNDTAMLAYAGTAVVPANGLPEAQALATCHAPSNDEDGIAQALEELVLTD